MHKRAMSLDTFFNFTGKTVLVTGASGGIGSTIARRFAEAGASRVVPQPLVRRLGLFGIASDDPRRAAYLRTRGAPPTAAPRRDSPRGAPPRPRRCCARAPRCWRTRTPRPSRRLRTGISFSMGIFQVGGGLVLYTIGSKTLSAADLTLLSLIVKVTLQLRVPLLN